MTTAARPSAPEASYAARVFAAFLAARAGFGLAYLAATLGGWPVLQYYPLARRWAFEARPQGFAMAWYGTTALALGAAIATGLVTWLASARGPLARSLARPASVLALARAGGLILLVDYVYFGWIMTHQTPAPLPLPDWYCPR